jgi:hypothetical protein
MKRYFYNADSRSVKSHSVATAQKLGFCDGHTRAIRIAVRIPQRAGERMAKLGVYPADWGGDRLNLDAEFGER